MIFDSSEMHKDDDTDAIYYTSKSFVHLIFAQEDSEAADSYNLQTLNFLTNLINR